jgi:hypothetical protein
MSPPTEDEYRIVRAGAYTAVYSRHTDGIYGDTRTWTRKHYIDDPTKAALKTLKVTHPGWRVTTLDDGAVIPLTAPFDYLASPDREWDKEQHELEYNVQRAEEQAARAWEGVVAAKVELERFLDEKKREES